MSAATELAARMPWTVAPPETWWLVTGRYGRYGGGIFTDCIARALPRAMTGTTAPVFEILVYGDTHAVRASSVTRATELLFVYASDPLRAFRDEDQADIDYAVGCTCARPGGAR